MARFPNGTRARMVITDLATETTTWLDRLLLQGTVTAQLNLPWQITGAVRSNDPAVNLIFAPDSDPRVAQSNRLVYVFLRDGPVNRPWQCRASGILMSPQDQGDADIATTHFTAYDPWQYLFGRPCFMSDGSAIGPLGRFFPATTGAVIAATLLGDTISAETVGCFIDAGVPYGGTAFWTGTLEATPLLNFTVQQGMTLGDAWNQLVAAGDPSGGTGGMDIVLEPIYDRINRPGYTSQLSIYNLAGADKPLSPMTWGKLNRSSTTADRQNDGTPGNFINVADFHVGQGGLAVPAGGPPPANDLSVDKYRPYWLSQFFPAQNQSSVVAAMETQTLILHKQGKRTFLLDPDPIRAAGPLRDYTVGDRVRVVTGDSLRVDESGFHRIEGIPLVFGPDGVTRVSQLLVTPDWRH